MNKIDAFVARLALPLVAGMLAGITAAVLFYEFHWRPAAFGPGAKVFNITYMGADRWTLRRVGSWNYWRKGLGDLREIRVHEGDQVVFRLISSDVTHGFALPAYGIRGIIVEPGEPAVVRITADKPGRFSIFCDRYCGLSHSDMRALFIVEPRAGGGLAYAASGGSAVERGRDVFNAYGCFACHGEGGGGGVINLNAQGGQVPALTRVAEGYTDAELKQKIRNGVPVVAKQDLNGQTPPLRMPAWKDMLTEPELGDLVAYLKSLAPKETGKEGW